MSFQYCLFIILILSTFLPPPIKAQLKIQSIQLNGLKRTSPDYLARFVDISNGQTFDLSTLEMDIQRLKNQNTIADAYFELDTIGQKVNIRFHLVEALTFFPILNFGGVRDNFWFQVGFTDDNWQGKGQKLTAFYQNNDRRNNFSLFYKIPYFQRSHWGASFSFLRWASIEPLFFDVATVFYDYDNLSFGLSTFFTPKRNSQIELGITWFVENYAKNTRHEDSITPGPNALQQYKTLTKLIHYHSKINYNFHQLSGYDNRASFQTVYNFTDNNWFHIFLNDSRYFAQWGKNGNFAARFRVGLATNNDSPFAPFVLDSYINIRGAGNRIDRGTAALILNLEYRHTIFNHGKIASQAVVFSDIGSWRNPGGNLKDLIDSSTTQHFMGVGLRLIYKRALNAIFRLDYGLDLRDVSRRGVVIGIGQYF